MWLKGHPEVELKDIFKGILKHLPAHLFSGYSTWMSHRIVPVNDRYSVIVNVKLFWMCFSCSKMLIHFHVTTPVDNDIQNTVIDRYIVYTKPFFIYNINSNNVGQ